MTNKKVGWNAIATIILILGMITAGLYYEITSSEKAGAEVPPWEIGDTWVYEMHEEVDSDNETMDYKSEKLFPVLHHF